MIRPKAEPGHPAPAADALPLRLSRWSYSVQPRPSYKKTKYGEI